MTTIVSVSLKYYTPLSLHRTTGEFLQHCKVSFAVLTAYPVVGLQVFFTNLLLPPKAFEHKVLLSSVSLCMFQASVLCYLDSLAIYFMMPLS